MLLQNQEIVDPAIPDAVTPASSGGGHPVLAGADAPTSHRDPVIPTADAPMTSNACSPRVPGDAVPPMGYWCSVTMFFPSKTRWVSICAVETPAHIRWFRPTRGVCPRCSLREIKQRGKGQVVVRYLAGALGKATSAGGQGIVLAAMCSCAFGTIPVESAGAIPGQTQRVITDEIASVTAGDVNPAFDEDDQFPNDDAPAPGDHAPSLRRLSRCGYSSRR